MVLRLKQVLFFILALGLVILYDIKAIVSSGFNFLRSQPEVIKISGIVEGREVEMAKAQVLAARQRLLLLLAGPRYHEVEILEAQLKEAKATLQLSKNKLLDSAIYPGLCN